MTAPLYTEEGKLSQRRRATIASLDRQISRSDTTQTLFEYYEATHSAPEDTTQRDDMEAKKKIHLLSQLAGLTHKQEETLVAIYVYDEDTNIISQRRRTTTRSVRGQRQTALESIQQLGYETVSSILTGSTRR